MTNEEREDAINFFKEVSRKEVGVYSKLAIEALEQHPCEDCISRQAARDDFTKRLRRWCVISEDGKFNNVGLLYDDVIFAMDKLPSVTPKEKTEWIPVSERLPEDGRFVLICDIDDYIMIGYHVGGGLKTHFSQDGTFEDMKNVKAWMPLPKPYEPQESEDEEVTE